MQVHVTYKGHLHIYELSSDATTASLKEVICHNLDLLPAHQKLLYKGTQLSDDAALPHGKIMLLASSNQSIEAVKSQADALSVIRQRRVEAGAGKVAQVKLNSTRTQRDVENSTYTFHRISPLMHLPSPDTSDAFLHRLANDGTIQKVMRRHRYQVGHLTEMDPRLYTQHDSKTLGLNKNAGQEILLRLRTDTLDGWRDYKTVRMTLVHELAHNVFGEHDRQFWDLFNLLMREVQEFESGQTMSRGDVYIPPEIMASDGGGERRAETRTLSGSKTNEGTSARDARARAAEARTRKNDV